MSTLKIDNLSIAFSGPEGENTVVRELSCEIGKGEILALVGESGSGKTMVSRAVLGLLPPGGRVGDGQIIFQGVDLTALDNRQLQAVRGAQIGMVFQEPMTSLNPALSIGFQMSEGLKRHFNLNDAECRQRSVEMLTRVGIPEPEACLRKYPHEFSGGMRQRILLAEVLMMKPALLIADEPTTALDMLVQKQVLDIMLAIVKEQDTSVLLITHDLGLVAKYADRVAVMRRGELMESGTIAETLLHPRHDYTRKLLAALPYRPATPPAPSGKVLCRAEQVTVRYYGRRAWPWQTRPVQDAVKDVSLDVHQGETLVVVGESGSGKTTFARAMLGLLPLHAGKVEYDGRDIGQLTPTAMRQLRQRVQMVFQDPYSALDPRMSNLAIVAEGLRHLDGLSQRECRQRSLAMLAEVGLDQSFAARFPHELSGGQRQRVNIARALVSEPEFIVADEPVSALDITVQAEILALFKQLQQRHGFSCLFITHDLGVAEQIADRVAVMYRASLVELGDRDRIFDHPEHPYTRRLLAAAPPLRKSPEGGYVLQEYEFQESHCANE